MIGELIRMARMFEGYEEEADGSTIFGKMYDLREKTKDVYKRAEWCMMGIEYCARACDISPALIPHTASCPQLLQYGEDHYMMRKRPKVGDICIFKFNANDKASHVGIVTAVSEGGDEFLTFEFNRKHTTGTMRPWAHEDRHTKTNSPEVVGFYRWEEES